MAGPKICKDWNVIIHDSNRCPQCQAYMWAHMRRGSDDCLYVDHDMKQPSFLFVWWMKFFKFICSFDK